MRMYYWENPTGMNPCHGQFKAKTDKGAIYQMPKTAICLYRESDTKDGRPFIVLYGKAG